MKLRDLDAQFCRREVRVESRSRVKPAVWAVRKDGPWTDDDFEDVIGPREYRVPVTALADADGISFLCPKCFSANGHSVVCWFTGRVPDDITPGPGRWNPSGTGLDDLTFVPPGMVSVQLLGGCHWHGHVVNGDAT